MNPFVVSESSILALLICKCAKFNVLKHDLAHQGFKPWVKGVYYIDFACLGAAAAIKE